MSDFYFPGRPDTKLPALRREKHGKTTLCLCRQVIFDRRLIRRWIYVRDKRLLTAVAVITIMNIFKPDDAACVMDV